MYRKLCPGGDRRAPARMHADTYFTKPVRCLGWKSTICACIAVANCLPMTKTMSENEDGHNELMRVAPGNRILNFTISTGNVQSIGTIGLLVFESVR